MSRDAAFDVLREWDTLKAELRLVVAERDYLRQLCQEVAEACRGLTEPTPAALSVLGSWVDYKAERDMARTQRDAWIAKHQLESDKAARLHEALEKLMHCSHNPPPNGAKAGCNCYRKAEAALRETEA